MATAEQVTPGHPDKVCDQISDALVDAYISQDGSSRCAVEVFAKGTSITVGGEVKSTAHVDVDAVVRSTLANIGYEEPWYPLSDLTITNILSEQSEDINQGVDREETIGAGDQGVMFGYATVETERMLPPAYDLACKLAEKLFSFSSSSSDYGPDGKVQVTLTDDGTLLSVVVSNQHAETLSLKDVRSTLLREVIVPVCGDGDYDTFINYTGRFVVGGPIADAGLTGRKIVADQCGPDVPVGGGAFSGKDGSKVDRSAAYMARYAAKHLVAAELCSHCLIRVAYCIGRADPTELVVETFGTGDDALLSTLLREHFDFTPAGIINTLGLDRPVFGVSSGLGHYTHASLPWENVNDSLVQELKK